MRGYLLLSRDDDGDCTNVTAVDDPFRFPLPFLPSPTVAEVLLAGYSFSSADNAGAKIHMKYLLSTKTRSHERLGQARDNTRLQPVCFFVVRNRPCHAVPVPCPAPLPGVPCHPYPILLGLAPPFCPFLPACWFVLGLGMTPPFLSYLVVFFCRFRCRLLFFPSRFLFCDLGPKHTYRREVCP